MVGTKIMWADLFDFLGQARAVTDRAKRCSGPPAEGSRHSRSWGTFGRDQRVHQLVS